MNTSRLQASALEWFAAANMIVEMMRREQTPLFQKAGKVRLLGSALSSGPLGLGCLLGAVSRGLAYMAKGPRHLVRGP